MSNVFQPVYNWAGPLSLDGDTFTPGSGKTWFLFASGSGWSTSGGELIGMSVLVNEIQVGICQVMTNEASSHKAFVPICVPLTENELTPGQPATVRLEPYNDATVTDLNDYFNVTVVEIDGTASAG